MGSVSELSCHAEEPGSVGAAEHELAYLHIPCKASPARCYQVTMHFWALAKKDEFMSNGKTSAENVLEMLQIIALHFSPLRRGRTALSTLCSTSLSAVAPLPPPEKALRHGNNKS